MNLLLPGLASAYLLTFARVGTLVMLMPGVGEAMVTPRLRLAFALLLSLVLFPVARPLLPGGTGPEPGGPGAALIGVLIGEIAVGLVLGLSVRAVIAALQTAGTIIAQQLGLAYAMTVDPSLGNQQATLGSFLSLLGLTLVLAADLHHLALAGIRDSYALMPPVGVPATGDAATFAVRAVARGFTLAVQISAPFIAFGILFNLGLGVLSRLMPQMQVFFVATPAAILIGMLVFLATIGVIMGVFVDDLGRFLADLGRA
ncbi:flagellar type III secretion system protein FliR [Methylobacterium currus]|uniref:Flagellar biosynthetic protein FliR n=1 Tax=Methylobacterium currus TaxID=2051553 RepID=A0A2R4WKV4_9HYPH|nr:flagellar biosynthetic protein FliR [Methylobacterium currus]AWB22146.1 flagellar type III secretion system protein FliR [Methylobacterium currus]UHC18227.1 flagellar type III secretion system protein FliR [Methylobacterium currus]